MSTIWWEHKSTTKASRRAFAMVAASSPGSALHLVTWRAAHLSGRIDLCLTWNGKACSCSPIHKSSCIENELAISDFAKRVPASVVSILAVMNSRKDHVWREVEETAVRCSILSQSRAGRAALPFGHHVRCNSSRRCPTIMRDSSGVLPPSSDLRKPRAARISCHSRDRP